jgi:hypothetical protein
MTANLFFEALATDLWKSYGHVDQSEYSHLKPLPTIPQLLGRLTRAIPFHLIGAVVSSHPNR